MSDEDGKEPIATGTVDLVGHVVLGDARLVPPADVTNVIMKAATDNGRWIETLTSQIGPARARFRSTYYHWAMAINGLHIAAERYASAERQAQHGDFVITGIRPPESRAVLASWSGGEASHAYRSTLPKMAAWGYIELYAALESSIFEFYRSYWDLHPDRLIRGPDFKDLRRLKRAAEAEGADEAAFAAWNEAWSERLDGWHRRKLYDGLHKVFLAFCAETGLKTPSNYEETTIDTWAETIEGLGLLRHLLIHGEQVVPDELEAFCAKPHSMSFKFKTGDPLRVDLFHLQAFELFSDQLLTGLNISATEHPNAGA
jgi:hypothetical protein